MKVLIPVLIGTAILIWPMVRLFKREKRNQNFAHRNPWPAIEELLKPELNYEAEKLLNNLDKDQANKLLYELNFWRGEDPIEDLQYQCPDSLIKRWFENIELQNAIRYIKYAYAERYVPPYIGELLIKRGLNPASVFEYSKNEDIAPIYMIANMPWTHHEDIGIDTISKSPEHFELLKKCLAAAKDINILPGKGYQEFTDYLVKKDVEAIKLFLDYKFNIYYKHPIFGPAINVLFDNISYDHYILSGFWDEHLDLDKNSPLPPEHEELVKPYLERFIFESLDIMELVLSRNESPKTLMEPEELNSLLGNSEKNNNRCDYYFCMHPYVGHLCKQIAPELDIDANSKDGQALYEAIRQHKKSRLIDIASKYLNYSSTHSEEAQPEPENT